MESAPKVNIVALADDVLIKLGKREWQLKMFATVRSP